MRVLCIGSSVKETTCTTNETLTEGVTLRLTDRVDNGGGHAGNIAYLLGKWGVETYIASMMGADDDANNIKKEYENIGVKIDYVETSYDKPTGQVVSIVNSANKNKTVLELANNSTLKKYSFNIEPDIVVSDGNDYNASSYAFDRYQKARCFLVVSSPRKEIIELSRYVHTIIFNQTSAESIIGAKIDFKNSSTLVNVYNKLKQKFSNCEVIITVGEHGSIYAINGQVKIMPPMKMKVVDTNGAGDVYAGAYIYGIGRDFGQERSVAYATIASSLSTEKLTSRGSIPTITEVSTIYDKKYGANTNPINTAEVAENNKVDNSVQAPEPTPEQPPEVQTSAPVQNEGAQVPPVQPVSDASQSTAPVTEQAPNPVPDASNPYVQTPANMSTTDTVEPPVDNVNTTPETNVNPQNPQA